MSDLEIINETLIPLKKTLRRFYIDFYKKLSQHNIKFVQTKTFENMTTHYEQLLRDLKNLTNYDNGSEQEDIRWKELLEENMVVCCVDNGTVLLTPESLVFILNLYCEVDKNINTIKHMNCVYDYDDDNNKIKMNNEIKIELSRFIKTFQRSIEMINKYIPFAKTLEYKHIFGTQEYDLTNWEKDMKEVYDKVKNISSSY